jgi:hypothetical protein
LNRRGLRLIEPASQGVEGNGRLGLSRGSYHKFSKRDSTHSMA